MQARILFAITSLIILAAGYPVARAGTVSSPLLPGASVEYLSSESATDTVGHLEWVGGEIKDFTVNTVMDMGEIYSAPFRLDRRKALKVGGLLATGLFLYAYDAEIMDWFMRNRDEDFYRPVHDFGESIESWGHMGKTNKYYFSALAVGYAFRLEKLTSVTTQILESYVIGGILKNVLNISAGRARPFADKGPGYFSFNDGTSLPSGHAMTITSLSVIVSENFDYLPVRVGAYTSAAAICLQRIASEGHWASDVYLGALLGWAVAKSVVRLDRERAAGRDQITILPSVSPEREELGIVFLLSF